MTAIASKTPKILVADDDPAILEALTMMLEDQGYQVDTAVNGEAIYKMEKDFPDLLLLDIWMSGTDGRDICRHLKQKKITKDIPIIMVSANKDTETIARESGADDFIAKPFDMDVLLNKLKEYLPKSSLIPSI